MAPHVLSVRLALGIACLAACGCGSTPKAAPVSPPFSAAASGTAAFPAVYKDWATVGYRLDWSGFPFPNLGKHDTQELIAYADVIVVLDRSSYVAVLEATTGERRWASELATSLTKFVGTTRDPLDAGRVIVSGQSEALVLATATGTLLAREGYSRVVNTRPLMAGNLMIFGTASGEVLAHLMGRDVKAWGFQSTAAISASPVRLVDGTVGVVAQSGDVMFFTPRGQLTGRGRILNGLANDPVTDGNLMYMAGLDQSVWCFAPSGTMVWRHRTSSQLRSQPTFQKDVLYCTIPKEGLTAFEGISGKVLWANKAVSGTVIGSRNGRALVWDADSGTLATVDPEDGLLVNSISLPGVKMLVPDAVENPNLYAVNAAGVVGKFIPRD